MKRSTWIMLGLFALLLVLYFVKTRKTETDAPPPLSIDGYVGNVDEQEFRAKIKDSKPPVTRVVLKRKDEEIVLDKLPADPPKDVTPDKDQPPPEDKWSAKRTYKGKTTEAKAQSFRGQTMSEQIGRSIRSSFAQRVKPDALAAYGLDADKALDVEWQLPDRTVKLRVGNVDKPQEMGGDAHTWVQDPARPDVVYQIAARDLRTSLDVTWTDLRDRGLLALNLPAVSRLEIENPQSNIAKKVVVQRPPLGDAKTRDAGEGWQIVEPAGQVAGDVGDWLKAIERLSASEFLDPRDVADKKLDTGLDDPAVAVKVTVHEGDKKTVIVLGKVDDKSDSKDVWARIEGRDEVYKIASYSRDQVVQSLDQLRDRRLLGGLKGKEAEAFSLAGPDGRVVASRAGGAWTVTQPQLRASSQAIETFLSDLDSVKVDYARDVTPTAAGLDTPTWTLELDFPGGKRQVVHLGAEKDGAAYGQAGPTPGTGDLFKLTGWNAGRLKKKPSDFADKRLLGVTKEAVVEAWLTPAGGEAAHLKKVEGGWTVTVGDKTTPAKAEAVSEWLATLSAVEGTPAAGKTAANAGLAKDFTAIRLADGKGGEWELRVSKDKAGDDPYAAAVRKGAVGEVVTIGSYQAGQILKKAEDFRQ